MEHSEAAMSQEIEEKYSSDASGTVTVTIANLTAGYERQYRLGRWAAKDAPVVAAKQRLRHKKSKPSSGQAERRR